MKKKEELQKKKNCKNLRIEEKRRVADLELKNLKNLRIEEKRRIAETRKVART